MRFQKKKSIRMYSKKLYLYYLKNYFIKKLFKIASLIGNPTRGIEWAANYCTGTIRRDLRRTRPDKVFIR